MAKTLRSQNKCGSCSNTWYPRGKNLSAVCPRCGSENVAVVTNWTPILAVVAAALYLGFGRLSSDSREAVSQPPTPVELAMPEAAAASNPLPFEPATLPARQQAMQKEEFIEPSRPVQSLQADEPHIGTSVAASEAVSAAAPAPREAPSSTQADPFERIYSDEEIAALENQKQYQGNDPIVRSRLGIPSRETRKLIR